MKNYITTENLEKVIFFDLLLKTLKKSEIEEYKPFICVIYNGAA